MIDSSELIWVERRGLDVLDYLKDGPADQCVSAMTFSEVLVGALMADSEQRKGRRLRFLETISESLPVLPFGEREARVHARLRTELRAAGQTIGAADLVIAATALANGHDLLTRNTREFRQVPGLRVLQTGTP
jgi:tRNA(fMet)-specific endonuclease VapC